MQSNVWLINEEKSCILIAIKKFNGFLDFTIKKQTRNFQKPNFELKEILWKKIMHKTNDQIKNLKICND